MLFFILHAYVDIQLVSYTAMLNAYVFYYRKSLCTRRYLSLHLLLYHTLFYIFFPFSMMQKKLSTHELSYGQPGLLILPVILFFSSISEFQALASTLFNWKTEIVNSFSIYKDRRVSNGPIEGRNSLIKKILRLANGYSNFERFRNRVIYCLNRYSTHSFKRE